MYTLALSTSTARGSVALLEDDALRGARRYEDRRHAERIFGEIDQLLDSCGVSRKALGGICCDVGPGSFTGTRVGLSSAKGIALGLGIPLWPSGALEAMALAALSLESEAASGGPTRIMPCVDAQRGEVFFALYEVAQAGAELAELVAPQQVSREHFAEVARGHVAGGARCCGAVLEGLLDGVERIEAKRCAWPDAEWLGRLAWRRYARAGGPQEAAPSLALIEPIYVRAPDAVPNLPKPPLSIS